MGEERAVMSWEEFGGRTKALFEQLLALKGKPPGDQHQTEARALFGWRAQYALELCLNPPRLCAKCHGEHQGLDALCYDCQKAASQAETEARIRADERARVEAEIREKMAKGGEF